ncbi:MAG TPA: hypothetical protein VF761_10140 [Gemmatimonadaceae bacterium]
MVRVHLMDLLVPVVMLGCAANRVAPRPGAYDSNLITEDEIVASRAGNAYEAIHKLRANFLSDRGMTSFFNPTAGMPTVYVDNQRYGDVRILMSIPAEVIATIRLLRSWDATTLYGTGNTGGVIAITTRQGGGEDAAWRSRYRH